MPDFGFSLSGVTLPDPDLFGIWSVAPQTSSVAFGVGESAAPIEPTWRVRLPESIDEAQSILDSQRASVQHSDSALEQAEQRLNQLRRAEAGLSFAAPGGPEAELLATVNALRLPVAYGLFTREQPEDQTTSRQWRSLLDQVRDLIAHYARVETEVGGALIGHTTVGWTGDFNTLWLPAVSPSSMNLHRQSVQLALASRLGLICLIGVVSTGAAGIAAKLTLPGGQLLVLPAIWKFVREVLAEWRKWKAIN